PRRADAAVRPGRDAAPGREAPGDLDAPGADDDAADLAAARRGPAGRRRVLPGGGVPPGRALPGLAQAGLDRLARPGEGDRAVRRHRTPGRDGDQRYRMARAPRVGGPDGYPAGIEAALDEHPAVQSCCVSGLPDEDLGNIPYAIVELSGPATDDDLLAHLRQRLAPYKLPRVIERATTPLRDDAGK